MGSKKKRYRPYKLKYWSKRAKVFLFDETPGSIISSKDVFKHPPAKAGFPKNKDNRIQ